MNLKSRSWLFALALVGTLTLAACGGSGGPPPGGIAVGSAGESLAFDKPTLTAPAGNVSIAFKNNSSGQQHNLVLIKGGEAEAAKIDEAAAAAGPPNYLPTDPNIVASTKMLAGQASETVSANLTAGSYTYICTFPGHYGAGMKGTLTVN